MAGPHHVALCRTGPLSCFVSRLNDSLGHCVCAVYCFNWHSNGSDYRRDMLAVIGEPSALAKADKIYAATHRVVVEEVSPQRDPDARFGASADLFGLGRASLPVRIAWTV